MGKKVDLCAYNIYQGKTLTPAYSESDSDNESCEGCAVPQNHSRTTIPSPSQVSNLTSDQTEALVSNITNAIHSEQASSLPKLSIVEKNFTSLCGKFPKSGENALKRSFPIRLGNKAVNLCIKAAEIQKDNRLPIMQGMTETKQLLSVRLPHTLQQSSQVATALDLLEQKFPKLAETVLTRPTCNLPRYVVAVPVPLNQEKRGSFFPEMQADGCIAYVAWDSSGREVVHGFKKKTCAILLANKAAFCGEVLSQENLKGIEAAIGVSDYFMTAKVTVIGVFIPELEGRDSLEQEEQHDGSDHLIEREGGSFVNQARIACDGLTWDGLGERLRERGGSTSLSTDTNFGMLGVLGAEASDLCQGETVLDRSLIRGEKASLFCLEIVPQFHSEENPVTRDNLEMAIDMQFQHLSK